MPVWEHDSAIQHVRRRFLIVGEITPSPAAVEVTELFVTMRSASAVSEFTEVSPELEKLGAVLCQVLSHLVHQFGWRDPRAK